MCRVSCYDNLLRMGNHGLTATSYAASFVKHLSKATNSVCGKTGALVESIGKWGFPVAGVMLAVNKLEICGITDKCIKIVSPGFTDGLNTEIGMNCLIIAIGVFAALKFAESLSDTLQVTSKNIVDGCEMWRQKNSQEIFLREKALKEDLKILKEKENVKTLEEKENVK